MRVRVYPEVASSNDEEYPNLPPAMAAKVFAD